MVAVASPACRSIRTWTLRPDRSTSSRGSPIPPSRQTWMPLKKTSSRSASKTASVTPMADSTRPQFGSPPKIAHLNRLLRATSRPTVSASRSDAAPTTSRAISCLAPSASAISWHARSWQSSLSAAVNSRASGVTPLAPEASNSTVSLVDMQPSASALSKLTRLASRSAASRAGASRSASVVSTTSIVASPGASIPAPLAMPPMLQPSPW